MSDSNAEICPFCDEWCGEQRAADLREYDASLPRWISVEERLPGEETVLVEEVFRGVEPRQQFVARYRVGRWYSVSPNVQLEPMSVTHWMPLPAPPKSA